MKIRQTAGRDALGGFAPQFAQLNDDVLFGEVWSSDGLSAKTRSMLTVAALVSKGLCDSSFRHHVQFAKENGVTRSEMADILTHLAFYAGWPNAWAAFRVAKEVYIDQRDIRAGLPQPLAHAFGNAGRRANSVVYRRLRVVSGVGTDAASATAGRRGDDPVKCQALARRNQRQLV